MTDPKNDDQGQSIDWSLTTFEGARRRVLARREPKHFQQVIQDLQDMAEFAARFPRAPRSIRSSQATVSNQAQSASKSLPGVTRK
ncbi:MAG TPA: hypothetical protein VMH77_04515 [Steroidobacteraceae bacterium]|nr:hypothetical protein [Steroidobacteraceae bacterium]